MNSVAIRFALSCLSLLLLTACTSGSAVDVEQPDDGGAPGPQMIANATEVIKFDPALIPTGNTQPVAGTCAASTIVSGSYRCELEAGGAAEPCFAAGGGRLLCGPDPVALTYAALVSPTGALPPVVAPPPDRIVQFFAELDDGLTCAIRTGPEPVIIDGATAGFDCSEPYTYLLGDTATTFIKDAPAWRTVVYTLDPATGEALEGDGPVAVRRVWIP